MKNNQNLSDIEEILHSQSYKPKKLPSITQDKLSIKSPERFQRRPTRFTSAPSPFSFPNTPPFFSINSIEFIPESFQSPAVSSPHCSPCMFDYKVPKFRKRKFGNCQERTEPTSGFISVKPLTSEKDILRLKKCSGRVSQKQKKRRTDRFEFTKQLNSFKYIISDIIDYN